MKLEFIEDTQDCNVIAAAQDGFIDLQTWLFDETKETHVKNLYQFKMKWVGTIRQDNRDLVTIFHEESWLLQFENTENENETLSRLLDNGFKAFELVFGHYAELLDYGELALPKPDNFTAESAEKILSPLRQIFTR